MPRLVTSVAISAARATASAAISETRSAASAAIPETRSAASAAIPETRSAASVATCAATLPAIGLPSRSTPSIKSIRDARSVAN